MVSRNRDGQGEVLSIFRSRESRREPLTMTEVADVLECSRAVASERLEQLVEDGMLETKQVEGGGQVWWRPGPEASAAESPEEGTEGDRLTDDQSGGERAGVLLVDDAGDVAWVDRTTADLLGVERETAVGQDRDELLRRLLDDRVRDEAVVDEVGGAPAEFADDADTVEFEFWPEGTGRAIRLEHGRRPIEAGRYAGGSVEFFSEVFPQSTPSAGLSKRDDLFRSLVEATEEYAIFMLDPDGHVISWNSGAERIKGYERSEVLGEHFSTFYTDEDVASGVPKENLSRALEEESAEDEGWRVRADGSHFWAQVTITPVRDDGELRGFAKVTRDMTDRREWEQRLERERNLLERTMDAIPVSVGVVSQDGEFVEGNPELAAIFGADSVDELVGSSVSELYPDPSRRAEFSERLEREGIVADLELEQETFEGETIWISVTAIKTEEDGDVYFDGVVQDVTDRKERQRELERYETLFEGSQDVNAIIDPDGTYSYLTPSTERVLGYDPEELEGENAFDYVHPDDRERIWDEFQNAVEDPEYSPRVELRFKHADGSWVVLGAQASNFLDDPNVGGIVAYTRDATERKLFQETLQALHESSRELIRSQNKTEVSETVVGAATSVLDLPGVVIYRHDDPADVLTLDEKSIDANFMREALPDFPVDHSSIVGHTFCDGEEKYYEDVLESEHLMAAPDEVDMTAGLFVPLGDHGVLVVGWHGEDACDDRTRQLIEILAANAEAAYTRVEREHELEEAERRYRTLAENFPNGAVGVYDHDLRYELVEGAMWDEMEPSAEDLVGNTIHEVFSEGVADDIEPIFRAAIEAGETESVLAEFAGRALRVWATPLRDSDGHVFSGLSFAQDVTDQVQYQQELETKARQQEVVADLGQRALGSDDLDALFDEAVKLVTGTLDSEYCKILDLDRDAEDLLLRTGIGLPDEHVGSATVDIGRESQAGYTLLADEPIVVEDMSEEDRFSGPDRLIESDVESGISAVIGSRASPWGVLATHDTDPRDFSEDDALFVQSVANILANAIDRRNNEVELEDQREHLEALNSLNTVVRDINEALVEQSTREEVERTVCERLADSESYQFAWIADIDPRTESLDPQVEAGVDEYVEVADIRIDEDCPEGQGPAGRAARSKEIHVTHDAFSDPTFEPWRDVAEEYGYRSSAAIPIVYQDTLYGILGIYTDRIGAFTDEEQEVVAQLGEIIGHAIASIERKQALMSDDVVEIDIRMENVLQEAGLGESMEGRIQFTEAISVGNGAFLQYGTATDGALETVEALVELLPHWDELTVLDETGETRFELGLSEPPVISVVADNGGYIDDAVIENDTMHVTIHLPPTVDVRRVVDTIQESYSTAEMVTRQQMSRIDSQREIEEALTQELTERQRAALEASFHAGFFDWPRESSGEEVAESLDVSAPTFHQHLRKAQQKLLESVLS